LTNISNKSITDVLENKAFVEYLQQLNASEIDDAVYELDLKISPQIDCTQCGNCCKTLMINVEEQEADIAAQSLNISRKTFDENYIEKSLGGKMVISKIACHFLVDNKCNIYLSRFAGCKEFPALHLPHIQKRLFTIFMHYGRCPIIFNVMEQLKNVVGFNAID
jgi:Fe-S-cluster containining protein